MGAAIKTAGLWASLVGITGAWGAAVAAGSDVAALGPRFNQQGWVQTDVHYDCSLPAPKQALASAGLAITASIKLGPLCVVEGWIAPEFLAGVAGVAGVKRVATPTYAVHPRRMAANLTMRPAASSGEPAASSGETAATGGKPIDQNGVTIMRADQFVSQTGTTGTGVKVGVQSAGISNLQGIESRGELPIVQVLTPSDGASSPGGDEGTVLLEEVHAVAPGAGLTYCGPSTFVEYTSCLTTMVGAGATLLVDDLIFPQQDFLSSDSSAVQAIEQLLRDNPKVTLFTAGGNYNGSYWEGTYTPVSRASLSLPPLTCPSTGGATQTDNYVTQFDGDPSQVLTVLQSSRVPFAFAWADPPGHNASTFDVYWVNADSTKSGCLYAGSATDNHMATNVNIATGTYTLYIATPDPTPGGKFLKLWIGGDGLTSISKPTVGAVVTPQALASGAVTVGAVNGSDGIGNTIESFSSLGPITVVYPQLARIQSPVLVAPDGINVDAVGTYFAGSLFPDGNFYGTSASAPNAAGVAALIRGAFPALTSTQLVAALQSGAAQLGSTVPDATFGYGRIDALGALATFPLPTMTSLQDSALTAGQSSPSYPFTVSGVGPLHFSVTSSNTTSIPAAVVPAGSPGVTITPSDCGVTTLTCSLSVMPAAGPGGTVNVTVATLDGANRSASASMKVTVTGTEAPPTSSTPPPSTGSGGGGGAIDVWVLVALSFSAAVCRGRGSRACNRNGYCGVLPKRFLPRLS